MRAFGRAEKNGPEGPEGVRSRRKEMKNNRKETESRRREAEICRKETEAGGGKRQFPNDACRYSSHSYHSLYGHRSCKSYTGYNSYDGYGSHKGAARPAHTPGSVCPLILR